jgi:hypothetical protein
VPEEHQEAAEEVRAHLVSVRGGAPFLSSSDALTLLQWLDDEVPVSSIQRAIERAAEYRRKKHSRLPLTLTRAKRHLGKAGKVAKTPTSPQSTPVQTGLAPLVAALHDLAATDERRELLLSCAARLAAAEGDAEAQARLAARAFREFFDLAWAQLGDAQKAWLDAAVTELADLADVLDEAAIQRAAEELARDRLRRSYPMLTVATVWQMVSS